MPVPSGIKFQTPRLVPGSSAPAVPWSGQTTESAGDRVPGKAYDTLCLPFPAKLILAPSSVLLRAHDPIQVHTATSPRFVLSS